MKELFRERDFTRVAYFRAVLEDAGIQSLIRNDLPNPKLSDASFFPALWVMNEEDYGEAMALIRRHLDGDANSSDADIICPCCQESNPGNFNACWNCDAALPTTS